MRQEPTKKKSALVYRRTVSAARSCGIAARALRFPSTSAERFPVSSTGPCHGRRLRAGELVVGVRRARADALKWPAFTGWQCRMGLQAYKKKRHFERTPEPEGKVHGKEGRSFVIQKHQASHLHYDFRLELNGVLKSWAVPKGPSLDPAVKRLAMQVEDHPVEYGAFEGIIPQGEYGGGTVLLWDRGHWEPIGDANAAYRHGRIKFKLHGAKLSGAWNLIRTSSRSEPNQRRWLLFKERDEYAKPVSEGEVTEELPLSVRTRRNLTDVAEDQDWVWNSKHTKSKPIEPRPMRLTAATIAKIPGIRKRKAPAHVSVQLAMLTKQAPEGDDWLHEMKFDGYRMVCHVENGRARFITRNDKDWTERVGRLSEAAERLPVRHAILDGEVVVLRPDGTTSFQDLQNALGDERESLTYYVFDLLYLDGYDYGIVPLEERKWVLERLLRRRGIPRGIRYSEHVIGNGPRFFSEACKRRLEGIISKRRAKPYQAGRSSDWLKVKCTLIEEFVIGGFSAPTGARTGLGALLVGYHDANGQLIYAGKVGTGFNQRTLHQLHAKLSRITTEKSPFADLKRAPGKVSWVKPSLVAQVTFSEWTQDGRLRHPSFQGLREDKPAARVVRENAAEADPDWSRHTDYDAARKRFAGVRLTSPDKFYYPAEGLTKLALAEYYRSVADWMLPHVANRPLVLVRCPAGQGDDCFYQKHPAVGTPDTLRQIPIREAKKTANYVVVEDTAGLVSLAQIGALEIHAWGARIDELEKPDRLIFDLDPHEEVPWTRVVRSAQQVRKFLEALGLESFVKTTGGKGLHLVVPIEPRHAWDEAKDFCKRVADLIVAADPTRYTANMSKAARPGKIFVDYLRNARGATAVVAYSTRNRPRAPVSVPLAWRELSPRIHSDHFTVRTLAKRLARLRADPWEGMASVRQSLTKPMKLVAHLSGR